MFKIPKAVIVGVLIFIISPVIFYAGWEVITTITGGK